MTTKLRNRCELLKGELQDIRDLLSLVSQAASSTQLALGDGELNGLHLLVRRLDGEILGIHNDILRCLEEDVEDEREGRHPEEPGDIPPDEDVAADRKGAETNE